MNFDNFYGPFYLDVRKNKITLFLDFTSNKNDSIKVHYGCFLYSISKSRINKYFKHIKYNSYDELVESNDFYPCLIELFNNLISNKSIYTFFSRRENKYLGELPYNLSYAYILGSKKELVSDYSLLDSSKLYSKNYESFKKMYDELALFHFKKRTEYYKKLMGIEYPIEIKLADATTFMGVNYIKKRVIKYDSYLYSFNEKVSDAIIVHELAHCFEANHSNRFYNIVLKYCPNYYHYHDIITQGRFLDE